MSQIDTVDEKILAELQLNGRLTMKALAERVGLSSPAMIERVRRLEERGVISGYRAVVTPAALGRPLTAMIAASVGVEQTPAFIQAVMDDPAISECHRMTGDSSHVLKADVADAAALEALIDRLSATGARCSADLVLSSPVPWRQVTPPEGTTTPRTRLTRRRRRAEAPAEEAPTPPTKTRRPGRPRRRTSAA